MPDAIHRATEIAQQARDQHPGEPYAALVAVCGGVAEADRYLVEWGEGLALEAAAFDKAGKQQEGEK